MSLTDELRERVRESLARAQESAALAQELAAKLATLSGSARSGDGGVRVAVDHRGLVTAVTFTERALGDGVDGLRESVLETTSHAVGDLRIQAERLQAPLRAGATSLQDTSVLDAYDDLLTAGPTRPAPRPTDGDGNAR